MVISVTFTSNLEPTRTVQEASTVTFNCQSESNSNLSLWLHDKTHDVDLFNGTRYNNSFEVSWQLTREDSNREFVCRAVGTVSTYFIESQDTFLYIVQCKYIIQCKFYNNMDLLCNLCY